MMEENENAKIYGLFKIIVIFLSSIIIGFFVIFFVATSKVNATQIWQADLPQDGQPYVVGTRSSGNITQRTLSCSEISNTVPPSSTCALTSSYQYFSIGLYNVTRVDRIYKVTLYYSLGSSVGGNNYQLNELTGICTGYNSICNTGEQTINYTRLMFDTNNGAIKLADSHLYTGLNNIPFISESNPSINMKKLEVIFKSNNNGPFITLYLNGTNSGYLVLYGAKIEDMGESSDVLKSYIDSKFSTARTWVDNILESIGTSKADITTAINNQTTTINNNTNSKISSQTTTITNSINNQTNSINNNTNNQINNSTNTITQNQNTNSQNEINNANNNSWECYTSVIDLIDMPLSRSKKYLNVNGEEVSSNGYDITDYVKVQGDYFDLIFHDDLSNDNQLALCLYDENYNRLSCQRYIPNVVSNDKIHRVFLDSSITYARFSFDRQATIYNEYYSGKYCVNRANNNTTIINNSVDNINGTLTDSNIDSPSSSLNGLNSNFANNGVISDLLLLPVSLFQNILNSVNGTCTDFTLGNLYNHNLTMPCINLSQKLGGTLYGVIDVLISGFFIFGMRKKFVDIFNNITSLKTGGNELE